MAKQLHSRLVTLEQSWQLSTGGGDECQECGQLPSEQMRIEWGGFPICTTCRATIWPAAETFFGSGGRAA